MRSRVVGPQQFLVKGEERGTFSELEQVWNETTTLGNYIIIDNLMLHNIHIYIIYNYICVYMYTCTYIYIHTVYAVYI